MGLDLGELLGPAIDLRRDHGAGRLRGSAHHRFFDSLYVDCQRQGLAHTLVSTWVVALYAAVFKPGAVLVQTVVNGAVLVALADFGRWFETPEVLGGRIQAESVLARQHGGVTG